MRLSKLSFEFMLATILSIQLPIADEISIIHPSAFSFQAIFKF